MFNIGCQTHKNKKILIIFDTTLLKKNGNDDPKYN